jgi:DNA-directed RNA polymerase subunit H (RpoH/RPB5)
MRRMVVELYGKRLGEVMGMTISDKVRSLELIHFLKFDRREVAAVGRVSLKEAGSELTSLFNPEGRAKVQLLEQEEGDTFVVLVGWKPGRGSLLSEHIEKGGGYMVSPFEFSDGRFRITFLGNQKQVQEFLRRADALGLSCRVDSVMDASFSPDSPLGCLTEKQRKVIVSAFKLGYYDLPRKLDSDDLAEELGLVNSTVVEHIRKAERRMLAEMLGER